MAIKCGATNPELADEIIFSHILPRLPAEDLMRCKCVCKSWSSLIRSPFFVAGFHDFHSNDTTNFFFERIDKFFSSKIEQQGTVSTPGAEIFQFPNDCFTDVQSVHGLVCVSFHSNSVFILNPTTRESIQLPHSRVIETRKPSVTYRFGYIPSTIEYKVLQILSFRLDRDGKWDLQFNTFTLGRDYWWRPLQVDPRHLPFDALAYAFDSYNNNISRHSGSVCLNGAVHWIYEKQKLIVAFSFREETFKAIPLPEDYDQEIADYFDQDANPYIGLGNPDDYCHPSMVKVGGCVGVIVDMSWKRDKIMLWTLKDYHNHVWVKETISLASEPSHLDCPRYVDALGTVHTGEFALVHYFVGLSPGYGDGPPSVLLYDMKSKRYRIIDFVFPDTMPKLTFRVGKIPLLKVSNNRCIGTRCKSYSDTLRTFPVAKEALRLRSSIIADA